MRDRFALLVLSTVMACEPDAPPPSGLPPAPPPHRPSTPATLVTSKHLDPADLGVNDEALFYSTDAVHRLDLDSMADRVITRDRFLVEGDRVIAVDPDGGVHDVPVLPPPRKPARTRRKRATLPDGSTVTFTWKAGNAVVTSGNCCITSFRVVDDRIAFTHATDDAHWSLYVFTPADGTLRQIADASSGLRPSTIVGHSKSHVFVRAEGAIHRVPWAGGAPDSVVTFEHPVQVVREDSRALYWIEHVAGSALFHLRTVAK